MEALRDVSAMHLAGKVFYRTLLGKNQQDFQHSLGVRICPRQNSQQGCGLDRRRRRAAASLGALAAGGGSWGDKERESLSLSPASGSVSHPGPAPGFAEAPVVRVQFVLLPWVHPAWPEETCPAAFSSKGKGLKSAERSAACQF